METVIHATLVEFLRARFDEDERYIRIMQTAGERFRDNATPAQLDRDTPLVREMFDGILDDRELVTAITAVQAVSVPNDLARMLREVEAKRKILAAYESARRAAATYEPGTEPEWHIMRRTAFLHACILLAAVYSDHPDYQEAWM